MTKDRKTSFDSLTEANRYRAKFSGHGKALGAAGVKEASYDPENSTHLRKPGESLAITPGEDGFKYILVGAAWDNIVAKKSGFFGKAAKKALKIGVDLDVGCLYELQDGTRGAVQAFGEKFGDFDQPPYMALSGDERTGEAKGYDEYVQINGAHWDKIKRVLVYFYIYSGAPNWAEINPKIILDVPGEEDLVVTLETHNDALAVCAVGGLENVRNGIKLTNYTEYFPGHAEMDRAFGFGLEWADGRKKG
ncbi:MAG: Tellurium resistance protein TerA [Alphaproteobacteria bacterium PRO2]|nr:Tellurium resistance protein TerA [Alphaproteobacteria bacterium PRO2]